MKFIVFTLICICLANHVSGGKHKRKLYLATGLKFDDNDDEVTFRQKIKDYVAASLDQTLAPVEDIQQKCDVILNAIHSDADERAFNVIANVEMHFGDYRKVYAFYKSQPTTPTCFYHLYDQLEDAFVKSSFRIPICRDTAYKDTELLKNEVDNNLAKFRSGIKTAVERIGKCAEPWMPQESAKCARRRSQEIKNTLTDIQKASKTAHKNMLNRLKVVAGEIENCNNKIIEQIRISEKRILQNIENCVGLDITKLEL